MFLNRAKWSWFIGYIRPKKSPVLRPGKAADGKLVIMQGCSDFHEECRNGGVLQELEQSPQNRINYDYNNRSKSKDF